MNTLTVTDGYVSDLPGLGKIRELKCLSEKRITGAVRANLRLKYGDENVHVTCKPEPISNGWRGGCTINGKHFGYTVSAKTIHRG